MMQLKTLVIACCASLTLTLGGCATRIKASAERNPPPAEKFSNFAAIEVKPARLSDAMAGNSANQRALGKIQENLALNLSSHLPQWNANKNSGGRTLVIEPVVEEIKFIGAGARVFAGPFAGSSAVIMKVKITDASNNKVIAHPEFFQRAEAWSGAFTLGVHDNLMLTRTARIASNYLISNYQQAVGGPTGGNFTE